MMTLPFNYTILSTEHVISMTIAPRKGFLKFDSRLATVFREVDMLEVQSVIYGSDVILGWNYKTVSLDISVSKFEYNYELILIEKMFEFLRQLNEPAVSEA